MNNIGLYLLFSIYCINTLIDKFYELIYNIIDKYVPKYIFRN